MVDFAKNDRMFPFFTGWLAIAARPADNKEQTRINAFPLPFRRL
jgi:hypothetical protein